MFRAVRACCGPRFRSGSSPRSGRGRICSSASDGGLRREVTCEPGTPDASSAPAALAAIHLAVEHVFAGRGRRGGDQPDRQGRALSRRIFRARPHRISRQACHQGDSDSPRKPVMMLWAPELAVVPVTIHLPLCEVVERSPPTLIVTTGRIVAHDLAHALRHRHGRGSRSPASIPMPAKTARWASEDDDIIAPAIAGCRREGIDVRGPAARRHDVPRRRPRALTTPRCACITTRR